MTEAMKQLALADDFTVVRAFETFHDALIQGSTQSIDTLIEAIPEAVRSDSGGDVAEILRQHAAAPLSEGDSVKLARLLLTAFAEDEAFAPLVVDSLANWRDDRQLVDVILAVGAVGAVWICLASTSAAFQGRWGKIEKAPMTEQQLNGIAAITRGIASIVRAARGGSRDTSKPSTS